jgi:hypothetical protein
LTISSRGSRQAIELDIFREAWMRPILSTHPTAANAGRPLCAN